MVTSHKHHYTNKPTSQYSFIIAYVAILMASEGIWALWYLNSMYFTKHFNTVDLIVSDIFYAKYIHNSSQVDFVGKILRLPITERLSKLTDGNKGQYNCKCYFLCFP